MDRSTLGAFLPDLGFGAPATVRNRDWILNARLLTARTPFSTPVRAGEDGWLYVYSGIVEVNGAVRLTPGYSIWFEASGPL